MQPSNRTTAPSPVFHKATPWLLGFAWTTIVLLGALPLIANVVDPLPPITPANTESVLSVARFVFESTFLGLERLWVVFTALALCVAVLLTLATALFINRHTENLGRLPRLLLWPALALPLAGGIAMTLL